MIQGLCTLHLAGPYALQLSPFGKDDNDLLAQGPGQHPGANAVFEVAWTVVRPFSQQHGNEKYRATTVRP